MSFKPYISLSGSEVPGAESISQPNVPAFWRVQSACRSQNHNGILVVVEHDDVARVNIIMYEAKRLVQEL
jgi:hypothetical protein